MSLNAKNLQQAIKRPTIQVSSFAAQNAKMIADMKYQQAQQAQQMQNAFARGRALAKQEATSNNSSSTVTDGSATISIPSVTTYTDEFTETGGLVSTVWGTGIDLITNESLVKQLKQRKIEKKVDEIFTDLKKMVLGESNGKTFKKFAKKAFA